MSSAHWLSLFWERVDTSGDCWIWTASKHPDGYGQVTWRWNGRNIVQTTHRFSYEINVGPIPPGMLVCHRCDNPPCVRPDHLFVGTHADNMRDKQQKNHNRIAAAFDVESAA